MSNKTTDYEFEKGYIYFPREWYGAISKIRLPRTQYAILFTIIIYTWGSDPYRSEAVITPDDFLEQTKITHRSSIYRAIRELIKKRMIIRRGELRHPIYSIQTDHKKWVISKQKRFSVERYLSQLREAGNE